MELENRHYELFNYVTPGECASEPEDKKLLNASDSIVDGYVQALMQGRLGMETLLDYFEGHQTSRSCQEKTYIKE